MEVEVEVEVVLEQQVYVSFPPPEGDNETYCSYKPGLFCMHHSMLLLLYFLSCLATLYVFLRDHRRLMLVWLPLIYLQFDQDLDDILIFFLLLAADV